MKVIETELCNKSTYSLLPVISIVFNPVDGDVSDPWVVFM